MRQGTPAKPKKPERPRAPPKPSRKEPVIVRNLHKEGFGSAKKIAKAFEDDARRLAKDGYIPSQAAAQGPKAASMLISVRKVSVAVGGSADDRRVHGPGMVVAMADSVAEFVADLALARPETLFNQYATEVLGLDRPGGAAIRCANLRAYLEPLIGVRLALIGEAPSAHGARFSGIAFTDERSMPTAQRTSADGLKKDGFAEHSATVLRGALEAAGMDPGSVILWNVAPFHPARADDPLRNRRPTSEELALGRRWLDRFLVLMQPQLVVGLGQSSKRVLPPGTRVLRHPANGGKPRLQASLIELAAAFGRDR